MNKQCAGDKNHWNEIQFLTETGVRNSLKVLDLLRSIKLYVSVLFIVLFFRPRRVITYEMTYFNSEYNYDKEVPKESYIAVLWPVNILDFDSSLLCMFTHMHIVLFSSHAYHIVNFKLFS